MPWDRSDCLGVTTSCVQNLEPLLSVGELAYVSRDSLLPDGVIHNSDAN